MNPIIERVRNADTIYLPKSEREQPQAIEWLQTNVNLDVPEFNDREYVKYSEGVRYGIVRAQTSLEFVEEDPNSIGFVGSDKFKEYQFGCPGWSTQLRIWQFGESTCRLALLGPVQDRETLEQRLADKEELVIATSYPLTSQNYARNKGYDFRLRSFGGGIEAMPLLNKADAVVDLVGTGDTMRQNGLEEVRDIFNVYPGVIWRSDTILPPNESAPLWLDADGLRGAIDTIRGRAKRVLVDGLEPSTYSEKLLSSPNEMTKKFGSEQAELLKAYFTESDEDVLAESADVIYSLMLLLASRKLNFEDVLNILSARNVPKK
jgi:ATP phosphoribosyltransferase